MLLLQIFMMIVPLSNMVIFPVRTPFSNQRVSKLSMTGERHGLDTNGTKEVGKLRNVHP